jgi:hypothetical protein
MIALTQDIILHINLLSINDFIIKDDDIDLEYDSSFKFYLYLDNVYLDVDERKLFGMSRHEYLLKLPVIQEKTNIKSNNQDISIMFNHPVSDLFMFAQNNDYVNIKEYYNFTTNRYIPLLDTSTINNFLLFDNYYELNLDEKIMKWYNFAIYYYYMKYNVNNKDIDKSQFYTIGNKNKLGILLKNYPEKYDKIIYDLMNNYLYGIDKNILIDNISLNVNSKNRFNCNSDFLLNIYNYQYYNHNIKGLYTYNFGINAKELQPSGSLNFCYLNKPFINISIDQNKFNKTDNYNLNIIGRMYNILKIMSGQGSLTYE